MGMFDWIKYEMDCPKCGARISGFQSKDAMCILAELEYWEVDNFYTSCRQCKAWVEFTREFPRVKIPITDYKMEVREEKDGGLGV